MGENPFLSIRLRDLILCLILLGLCALVVLVVAMRVFGFVPGLVEITWGAMVWLQVVPMVWLVIKIQEVGVSMGGLLGRSKAGFDWAGALFYLLPMAIVMGSSTRIGLQLLEPIFGFLFQALHPPVDSGASGDTSRSVFEAFSWREFLWTFLFTIILAPVVEELLFRGVLLQRWAARWHTKKALILSSLLFALVHGPAMWAGAFLFGVFMGMLYMQSGTLRIPILFHALHNVWAHTFGRLLTADDHIAAHGGFLLVALPVMLYYFYKNRSVLLDLAPPIPMR